uniref:Uncharacterized protein n=1 Tax=Arundo donax TaxID=35708 RepID=A0A0A9H5H7_ARUDO
MHRTIHPKIYFVHKKTSAFRVFLSLFMLLFAIPLFLLRSSSRYFYVVSFEVKRRIGEFFFSDSSW